MLSFISLGAVRTKGFHPIGAELEDTLPCDALVAWQDKGDLLFSPGESGDFWLLGVISCCAGRVAATDEDRGGPATVLNCSAHIKVKSGWRVASFRAACFSGDVDVARAVFCSRGESSLLPARGYTYASDPLVLQGDGSVAAASRSPITCAANAGWVSAKAVHRLAAGLAPRLFAVNGMVVERIPQPPLHPQRPRFS